MKTIQYLTLAVLLMFPVAGAYAQAGGGGAGGGGGGGGAGGGGGGTPKAATASGTVLKVSGNAFIILDTSGNPITIPTTAVTAFLINKTPVTFQDVIRPGMKVKATAAPDGSAAQVTASGMATSLNANQLQAFLGAADDEWVVLKPHLDRIKALKSELSGNGGGGGGGNGNAAPAPSALETASQALNSVAFDEVPLQSLAAALKAQRDARAKLTTELSTERTTLIKLLTARQEALLVAIGVLD